MESSLLLLGGQQTWGSPSSLCVCCVCGQHGSDVHLPAAAAGLGTGNEVSHLIFSVTQMTQAHLLPLGMKKQ